MAIDHDLTNLRRTSRASYNVRPIVWGQAISLFGDYIAYFTLPYFLVVLTGRELDLGLVAAAETVPMLLFGFSAGVILDRIRLRPMLVFADIARSLAFLLLALGVYSDSVAPYMVFAAAFIVGSMAVFFDSGLQAYMPQAIGEELLLKANSALQLARTAAFVAGPVIGGLVVGLPAIGFETAFILNAITFAASAVFLTMIRPAYERQRQPRLAFFDEMRAGLGFLMRHAVLRTATLAGTVTNLVFTPLEALLVLFVAAEIPKLEQLAGLSDGVHVGAFIGVQAAVGSIGVAIAPRVERHSSLAAMFIAGLVMLGSGFLTVAVTRTFWSAIAAGVGLAGVGWVNVALTTLRQTSTPEHLQGRVIAASRSIAWAGLPLGAIVGSAVADLVGMVPVYIAGSSAVIVVALVVGGRRMLAEPAAA
ncbi:MAG: MFS transporter [Acidimicrobiia bacterium]|nr:MFS transporter [Acidimicrobiia bacterium]